MASNDENAGVCGRVMQGGRICSAPSREVRGPCNRHMGRPDTWVLCPKMCGHSLRRTTKYELCGTCAPSVRVMDSQKKGRTARTVAEAKVVELVAVAEASATAATELEVAKTGLAEALERVKALETRLAASEADCAHMRGCFQSYMLWAVNQGGRVGRG